MKMSNFVIEESSHGKSVQSLIAAATYTAIIHVRGYRYAQTFLPASETQRRSCGQVANLKKNTHTILR